MRIFHSPDHIAACGQLHAQCLCTMPPRTAHADARYCRLRAGCAAAGAAVVLRMRRPASLSAFRSGQASMLAQALRAS